ncbi:hypothetical protein [Streptomyces vinaceus]|uniref:hypothetical protein n=1 Tax=Streptomyces vinaceus TaxID=1960 RepID=UPI0036C96CF6
MNTPKPAAGQIWYDTEEGTHVLLAGADRTHAAACRVAIRRNGQPIAHPRGRKAERILVRDFTNGQYEYVVTAKAVASDGR